MAGSVCLNVNLVFLITSKGPALVQACRRFAQVGAVIVGLSGCTGGETVGTEYTRHPDKIEALAKRARAGDSEAAYRMAQINWASPEALLWICRAAVQGHIWAQIQLGALHRTDIPHSGYLKGALPSIRPDNRVAYIWYGRAAEKGNEYAVFQKNQIADRLTSEQLIEAKSMARNWKPGDCPSPEHPLVVPSDELVCHGLKSNDWKYVDLATTRGLTREICRQIDAW